MMRFRTLRAIAVVAGVLAPLPAMPCAFHNYDPPPSIVEALLTSTSIMLARSSPDDPFRYRVVEAVRGDMTGSDIPHLVDSRTRIRLAENPDDKVLFSLDATTNKWVRMSYIDSETAPIFERIFSRLDDWAVSEDRERYQIFGDLLDHDSRQIRRLALTELDQAPYDLLRALELQTDAGLLSDRLYAADEIGLRAIKILLLGFSDGARGGEVLHIGFERELLSANRAALGAYATAMIEFGGTSGVEALAEAVRSNPGLDEEAYSLVIEAIAIQHSYGSAEVREAIDVVLPALLDARPSLSADVALQFGSYGNWSQVALLSQLLRERRLKSATEVILVSHYVALAGNSLPGDVSN